MARRINLNWSDLYEYVENNEIFIPNGIGVYEICARHKDGIDYKYYVGSSNRLSTRFLEHLSDEEENEGIKYGLRNYICSFRFAQLNNEDQMKDAEFGLYKKHSNVGAYEWNNIEPDPSSLDRNIEVIEQ